MILHRRQSEADAWEECPSNDYADKSNEGYLYRWFRTAADAEAGRSLSMKVSLGIYTKFVNDYWRSDLKDHLRLGQAFINEVLPSNVMDPDLFHERNPNIAEEKIYARYIETSAYDQ